MIGWFIGSCASDIAMTEATHFRDMIPSLYPKLSRSEKSLLERHFAYFLDFHNGDPVKAAKSSYAALYVGLEHLGAPFVIAGAILLQVIHGLLTICWVALIVVGVVWVILCDVRAVQIYRCLRRDNPALFVKSRA